jgi:hypothetical protein
MIGASGSFRGRVAGPASPAELIVYRFAAARLTEKLFFITAVRVVAVGT